MNRSKKLIIITIIFFTILGCFLQGCSEGREKSPVSIINYEIRDNIDLDSSYIVDNDELLPDKTINSNVDFSNSVKDISFKVISAFTGSQLEFATVSVDGENVGITDSNGEIEIKYLKIGIHEIEIKLNGYDTLIFKRIWDINDNNKKKIITMVENLDNSGSVTGTYIDDASGKKLEKIYLRLYKISDKNTNSLDKDYILTTTSSNEKKLAGSFKFTNLESGIYQMYIGNDNTIPELETVKENNNKIVKLKKDIEGQLAVTEPFIVDNNKTIFWTN